MKLYALKRTVVESGEVSFLCKSSRLQSCNYSEYLEYNFDFETIKHIQEYDYQIYTTTNKAYLEEKNIPNMDDSDKSYLKESEYYKFEIIEISV